MLSQLKLRILTLLVGTSFVFGQFPNCTKAGTAFCESPVVGVTENSIIFRCLSDTGEASPANCNDK